MRQLEQRRGESGHMIDELLLQRTELRRAAAAADSGTKCGRCTRPLGPGPAIAFRCGHAFHPPCLEDAQRELGEIRAALRRRGRSHDDGCPVCGPPSAVLVHLPINHEGTFEWTMEL
jgi:hypothetical protein